MNEIKQKQKRINSFTNQKTGSFDLRSQRYQGIRKILVDWHTEEYEIAGTKKSGTVFIEKNAVDLKRILVND